MFTDCSKLYIMSVLDQKSNKYFIHNAERGAIMKFLKKVVKMLCDSKSPSHQTFAMIWLDGRVKK